MSFHASDEGQAEIMQNNLVETLIGAVVVGVAIVFFLFAYRTADTRGFSSGYTLSARVNNITGVGVGTDVRISGIKIGSVSRLDLDPETFEAVLSLSIDSRYRLTEDTSLSIASESLLGGNFVTLQPGGDFESLLQDGDEIVLATGTVDLLSLIQQALFGTGDSPGSSDDEEAATDTSF